MNKTKNVIIASVIGIIAIVLLAIVISSFARPDAGLCRGQGEDPNHAGYCPISEESYDQLIIISGNTQNTPEPDLDFTEDESAAEILSDVFYSSAQGTKPNISIISVSGDNHTIEFDKKSKYITTGTIEASESNLKKLAKELNKAIKEPASSHGANYTGAIAEAKSLINPSSEHPAIIIVGSGLSDSGVLDFAHDDVIENYYDSPSSIVNTLEKNPSVVKNSLKGVSVIWYNLGNTVAPQPSMNEEKATLQNIYNSLFSYVGADEPEYLYKEQSSNDKSVDSPYTVQPTFPSQVVVGDKISFNEYVGAFQPDKAVLINSDSAKQKLASFVRKLNRGDKNLKLTGYIAICVDGATLGKERADAIKELLVSMGVDEKRISTYGEPGQPPVDGKNESYSCNRDIPDEEKRTVMIEVVEQ
ncbi:hypothetical protein IKG60_00815 [Candidatus Saccharibacteria bacterium]|nr:hypothetical protein [Candidatus Saccharibacteria bacterium]